MYVQCMVNWGADFYIMVKGTELSHKYKKKLSLQAYIYLYI